MTNKILLLLVLIMVLGGSSIFGITPIPVQFFSYSKLPVIEVVIGEKKYYLELDTGAVGDIVLKKEILEHINKIDVGVVKTVDINGNIYENLEFLISNIKIGGLDFESVTARQENIALLTEGCLVRDSSGRNQEKNELRLTNIAGRIGWGILKKHRWYFDFFHSLLWVVDDLNELEMEVRYFSILDHVEIPFEIEDNGIVISVDTNIGTKRLMLDTGANVSCLRESLVQKKYAKEIEPGKWMFLSKIKIGGVHFGNYPFFLYDFTSMIDVDGVLSIQFFERNGIYLDFQNKRALISPAKRPFWLGLVDRIQCFWRWLTYMKEVY